MERIMPLGRCGKTEAGFTYLGLLLTIALSGVLMTVAAQVWQTRLQRENELELLFVGQQIQAAIGRYYEESPGEIHRFPPTLQDLLLDPRFPSLKRHLRKLYADPFAPAGSWGLVLAEEGGVQGVYSFSTLQPLKVTGFAPELADFEKKRQYQDWKFVYTPENHQPTGEDEAGEEFAP